MKRKLCWVWVLLLAGCATDFPVEGKVLAVDIADHTIHIIDRGFITTHSCYVEVETISEDGEVKEVEFEIDMHLCDDAIVGQHCRFDSASEFECGENP